LGAWHIYLRPFRQDAAVAMAVRERGGEAVERPTALSSLPAFLGGDSFYRCKGFILRHSCLEPDLLEAVLRCRNLEAIFFERSGVKAEQIKRFQQLPGLRLLILKDEDVDRDTLAAIGEFKDLRRIEIHDQQTHAFGDDDLFYFRNLLTLEGLILFGTRVRGEGFAHLSDLRNLRMLWIEGHQFNDAGLATVCRHMDLHRLSLVSASLTDDGFAPLRSLRNLKELKCYECALSDAVIPHIEELFSLEKLILYDTRLKGTNVGRLKHLKKLNSLHLGHNTPMTDDVIPELSQLQQLNKLSICGSGFSAEGRRRLKKAMPNTCIYFHRVEPGT